MRVLIDATAVPADRGGVGRYVDELVPALTRLNLAVQVVCQPRDALHYAQLSNTDAIVAGPGAARPATRLLWEQVELPRLVSRSAPDVLHSPHYTRPELCGVPSVVTLHDATFFTDPQVHSALKGRFFRVATRRALRRAGCCVVPSQATALELARAVGADPAKLVVAHHGVDTALFAPPTGEQIARARRSAGLGVDEPYIAFLGTLEPRKNIPALMEGFARAVAARREPPALVLAGARGWDERIDEVVATVTSRDPRLKVLRPGYLPLEDLAGFLGGAQLVAYPSLIEGFGLPVLEAMACGAAVLTTRMGPLPEVGGDAVAYTGTSAGEIALDLTDLLDDQDGRAALGAAGQRRAAMFTWHASAQRHLEAYQRAIVTSGAVHT